MLRRLAKDRESGAGSRCPALYATEDPARMVAQVRLLGDTERAELVEVGADEVAGSIPTETVFRAAARCAAEQGDDGLAVALEAFLAERGM